MSTPVRRQCPSVATPIAPDELIPEPVALVPENRAPHPDRAVAGAGRRSPDRPGLRLPPQRGDFLTLRLALEGAAELLEVGRDGGHRLTSRSPGTLPAPVGHGPLRLRRHPAQPRAPLTPAGGRGHDPGDEQRHLQRHLLDAPCLRHRRRWHSTPPVAAGRTARLRAGPRRLRGHRPGASSPGGRGGVGTGATLGRRPHLARRHSAPRARAACPRAAPLRSPLVCLCSPRVARRGKELRGPRAAGRAGVLHLVLPVLTHPGDAICPSGSVVAADHPL